MELSINPKLKLRTLDFDEASNYYHLIKTNRAYLGKWLPWALNVNSLHDQEETLRKTLLNEKEQPTQFSIYWQNTLVGRVSFVHLNVDEHFGEIGYWLAADAQGHGIMHLAVTKLADYGFNKLGLKRLDIKVAAGNDASLNVAKLCGFKHEDILPNAITLASGLTDAELLSKFAENN